MYRITFIIFASLFVIGCTFIETEQGCKHPINRAEAWAIVFEVSNEQAHWQTRLPDRNTGILPTIMIFKDSVEEYRDSYMGVMATSIFPYKVYFEINIDPVWPQDSITRTAHLIESLWAQFDKEWKDTPLSVQDTSQNCRVQLSRIPSEPIWSNDSITIVASQMLVQSNFSMVWDETLNPYLFDFKMDERNAIIERIVEELDNRRCIQTQ